ncbi:MAG TPA: NADH-quinone oxidoreductase subunit NuoE [Candidatus Eisenbacteria bacterium]|nr:NADH-quinone oxidoreductase subunit NuoE [Candidatus Eisenbacteria bacterium]
MTGSRATIGVELKSAGKPLAFEKDDRDAIAQMAARYPDRSSAVMPALWLAQKRFGFLSKEAVAAVAEALQIPEPEVAGVATFYSMYNLAPTGRHILQVCMTLSCSLLGADALLAHMSKKLGIEPGETTPDGKFTLRKVECLASCGTGPCLQVNEQVFQELLDPASVDKLIESLP